MKVMYTFVGKFVEVVVTPDQTLADQVLEAPVGVAGIFGDPCRDL